MAKLVGINLSTSTTNLFSKPGQGREVADRALSSSKEENMMPVRKRAKDIQRAAERPIGG